ncbi:unnamed protein product, partial [Closterium sp. NIES-53]
GAEPGGAETEDAELGGAESEGAESGGAEFEVAESRGPPTRGTGAGGAGATSPGGAGVTAGAGGTGGAGAAGPRGARTRGTGAAEAGGVGVIDPGAGGADARGAGAGGAGAIDPGTRGTRAGGTVVVSAATWLYSPLPAPSPYVEQTVSVTERRELESRPASPVRAVRTGRRVPRPRPPPVLGTHIMALLPSFVPLRVPLPSPPTYSLADGPDPESDFVRAANPTVTRLLATVVTDPSFESYAVSALVAELVDFAAACRLCYSHNRLECA